MDSPSPRPPGDTAAPSRTVRVWDLPTRAFHWLLVVLVVVNIYTGNVGGVANMEWHMLSGYAILTLVLFRLAWGLVGSRHSRFASFIRGPLAALAYLRSLGSKAYIGSIGHNPLGGWSVAAMLTSLLIQAGTGLFADDDILTEGPLARSVSKATRRLLTGIHDINANVLYVLIGLHLAAVSYYLLVRRDNLVLPMLTGRKQVQEGSAVRNEPFVSPWLAMLLVGLAGALVWWLVDR